MANTSKIGSATTDDYATLTAWEAATDNDLVTAAAGEYAELQENISEAVTVTIAGATTDATYYRKVYPVSGSGWNQSGDTAIYEGMSGIKFSSSNNWGLAILLDEPYGRLEDMIVEKTGNNASALDIDGNNSTVTNCIAVRTNTNTSAYYALRLWGGGIVGVNCYAAAPNATTCRIIIATGADLINSLALCKDAGGIDETHQYTGGPIKNTAYDGDWSSTTGFAAGTDYNSSSGTTVPGANSIQSTVLNNAITSRTTDWRAASGQAFDGAGLTVSGYETDCFGNTRSGACTIGPYEIQAAAGGGNLLTRSLMGVGA